jgi:hypothetical protein
MKLHLSGALALLLATTTMSAAAPITPQDLASRYQAEGFSRVEIEYRGDRAEVEAIRGSTKIERLYDLRTGAVIRQEQDRVDDDDNTRPGVYVRHDDDDDDRWDDARSDDDRWDDDGREDRDDRWDDDDDDRDDDDGYDD